MDTEADITLPPLSARGPTMLLPSTRPAPHFPKRTHSRTHSSMRRTSTKATSPYHTTSLQHRTRSMRPISETATSYYHSTAATLPVGGDMPVDAPRSRTRSFSDPLRGKTKTERRDEEVKPPLPGPKPPPSPLFSVSPHVRSVSPGAASSIGVAGSARPPIHGLQSAALLQGSMPPNAYIPDGVPVAAQPSKSHARSKSALPQLAPAAPVSPSNATAQPSLGGIIEEHCSQASQPSLSPRGAKVHALKQIWSAAVARSLSKRGVVEGDELLNSVEDSASPDLGDLQISFADLQAIMLAGDGNEEVPRALEPATCSRRREGEETLTVPSPQGDMRANVVPEDASDRGDTITSRSQCPVPTVRAPSSLPHIYTRKREDSTDIPMLPQRPPPSLMGTSMPALPAKPPPKRPVDTLPPPRSDSRHRQTARAAGSTPTSPGADRSGARGHHRRTHTTPVFMIPPPPVAGVPPVTRPSLAGVLSSTRLPVTDVLSATRPPPPATTSHNFTYDDIRDETSVAAPLTRERSNSISSVQSAHSTMSVQSFVSVQSFASVQSVSTHARSREEECSICATKFSFGMRKKTCHSCATEVCLRCSDLVLDKGDSTLCDPREGGGGRDGVSGKEELVRVCRGCYDKVDPRYAHIPVDSRRSLALLRSIRNFKRRSLRKPPPPRPVAGEGGTSGEGTVAVGIVPPRKPPRPASTSLLTKPPVSHPLRTPMSPSSTEKPPSTASKPPSTASKPPRPALPPPNKESKPPMPVFTSLPTQRTIREKVPTSKPPTPASTRLINRSLNATSKPLQPVSPSYTATQQSTTASVAKPPPPPVGGRVHGLVGDAAQGRPDVRSPVVTMQSVALQRGSFPRRGVSRAPPPPRASPPFASRRPPPLQVTSPKSNLPAAHLEQLTPHLACSCTSMASLPSAPASGDSMIDNSIAECAALTASATYRPSSRGRAHAQRSSHRRCASENGLAMRLTRTQNATRMSSRQMLSPVHGVSTVLPLRTSPPKSPRPTLRSPPDSTRSPREETRSIPAPSVERRMTARPAAASTLPRVRPAPPPARRKQQPQQRSPIAAQQRSPVVAHQRSPVATHQRSASSHTAASRRLAPQQNALAPSSSTTAQFPPPPPPEATQIEGRQQQQQKAGSASPPSLATELVPPPPPSEALEASV